LYFFIDKILKIWYKLRNGGNKGMNIILKYFAGIGVIIGLLNTFITYKKMKKINQNIENNDEINNFIKWYGIYFTVPFILLQIFQLLGNYRSVFYIFLLDFNNIYYILGFVSMIFYWILMLYLVIIKNGAEIIIKYNGAFRRTFGNMSKDKTKLKIFLILMVLCSLIILLFGNKIMGGVFSDIEKMNILEDIYISPLE
jgi:hypothetical protein